MPTYNKLVTDKIPKIIEQDGKKAKVTVLDDIEYHKCLINKLHEEVQEFIESDDVEEIADIIEVIDSILKVKGITWSHIRDIQDNKRKKNGGFNKKYFLISVEG